MGRRKIAIKPITDPKKRKITLSKRKSGLLKKAYELSVLCGCEVGIVMFDADQQLHSYGSCGIEKTVKRWQDTKTMPSANWSNDDFDEASGKFRRHGSGGAAAGGEDEDVSSDEDEEEPIVVVKSPPSRRKPRKGSTSSATHFVSVGAAGKSKKKRGSVVVKSKSKLSVDMDAKPAKRHSNPRKEALENGVFSIPMLPPALCEPPHVTSYLFVPLRVYTWINCARFLCFWGCWCCQHTGPRHPATLARLSS
eukprot:m.93055 g.93055  ORF g.93055 m.93055 type:complete len:251 (+) comp20272_c0_seq4:106-858(+)